MMLLVMMLLVMMLLCSDEEGMETGSSTHINIVS